MFNVGGGIFEAPFEWFKDSASLRVEVRNCLYTIENVGLGLHHLQVHSLLRMHPAQLFLNEWNDVADLFNVAFNVNKERVNLIWLWVEDLWVHLPVDWGWCILCKKGQIKHIWMLPNIKIFLFAVVNVWSLMLCWWLAVCQRVNTFQIVIRQRHLNFTLIPYFCGRCYGNFIFVLLLKGFIDFGSCLIVPFQLAWLIQTINVVIASEQLIYLFLILLNFGHYLLKRWKFCN